MAKKSRKKKEKHIVGTKELIFDIVSIVLIISLALVIGFRSIKYYSKEQEERQGGQTTLASLVISNNPITKSDTGLRKSKEGYYFVGKVENNYLKVFNRLYRIIEVTDKNEIKIVSTDNEAAMIYGISNDYKTSNINNWLNKTEEVNSGIYQNTIPGVKQLLTKTKYCESTLKNEKIKCSKNKESSYFSILTVDDYVRAQGKNSYLNNGKYSFILGFDENNNPLYITEDGSIDKATNYDGYGIRVVMTLKKNTLTVGGTGTKEDPYVVNQEGNDNYINKYVRLGQDLYQVILEENNSLKLRQTSYLTIDNQNIELAFSTKEPIFNPKNRYNIGYYLNNTYYNTLPYKNNLIDCNFYIGEISTNTSYSYNEIYKENILSKVGLLNMFDLNTNTEQTDYYLINKTSNVGSMMKVYNKLGIIDDEKTIEKKKIVPVVCIDKTMLKNGNGNIDNPYIME